MAPSNPEQPRGRPEAVLVRALLDSGIAPKQPRATPRPPTLEHDLRFDDLARVAGAGESVGYLAGVGVSGLPRQ